MVAFYNTRAYIMLIPIQNNIKMVTERDGPFPYGVYPDHIAMSRGIIIDIIARLSHA